MELTGLVPILRRWATVILVATGMAVVIGLVVGVHAQKTYEARSELLVGPLSTDSNTMKASGDLTQTYAELATSSRVLGAVSGELKVSQAELAGTVRSTANSATRFLIIRARSHDPATAVSVADSISRQLISLSRQDLTRPEGQLRVIDPATKPTSPISPKLDLIVPLAAVAGLLGSITLILLFEFVGDTAESTDKVEQASGIAAVEVKRRRRPAPDGRSDDPLRVVATQAELSTTRLSCVLVTGVERNDGSDQFALDLAAVWHERRSRVVVLDAGTGEVTDLEHRDGSTEPGTATDRGPLFGLERLDVTDVRSVISELVGTDGLLVVHGPPATISAATLVWAQVAEVTLLVVRRFQGRRSDIDEAASNLRIVNAHLPFTVLLDVPSRPWKRAARRPAPVDPHESGLAADPARPGSPTASTENTAADQSPAAVPTPGTTVSTKKGKSTSSPGQTAGAR